MMKLARYGYFLWVSILLVGQAHGMVSHIQAFKTVLWQSPLDEQKLVECAKKITSGERLDDHSTALHILAEGAPTKLVGKPVLFKNLADQLLATEPAIINAPGTFEQYMPLHCACSPINAFLGDLDLLYDIIDYLLDKGADINGQAAFGWTPLYKFLATFTDDEIKDEQRVKKIKKIIQLLLQRGANGSVKAGFTTCAQDNIDRRNFELFRFVQEYTSEVPAKTMPTWLVAPETKYKFNSKKPIGVFDLHGNGASFLHKIENLSFDEIKNELKKLLLNDKNHNIIRNTEYPYQTLLHVAAGEFNVSEQSVLALKAIIKYAAYPPDVRDKNHNTPLHYAVQDKGDAITLDPATDKTIEVIDALLEYENDYYPGKKSDINATDKEGNTPLHHLAARNDYAKNKEVIKAIWQHLVSKGAGAGIKNNDGQTPEQLGRSLHPTQYPKILTLWQQISKAVKAGDVDTASKLFDANKAPLDWDRENVAYLMSNLALAYPKDTSDQEKVDQITALAQKLITAGMPEDVKNYVLWQIIGNTNTTSSAPLVELLLDHGAKPDVAIENRGLLLHEAILRHSPYVERLLEKCSNINVKDGNGNTPLMQAVNSGDFDTIGRLLAKNADVTIKNKYGQTALHEAVFKIVFYATGDQQRQKYWALLGQLIEKGANPFDADAYGRTLESIIQEGSSDLPSSDVDFLSLKQEANIKRLEALVKAHHPGQTAQDLEFINQFGQIMKNAQAALTMSLFKIDAKKIQESATLLHAVAYLFPERDWSYQNFEAITNLLISKDPSMLSVQDLDGNNPLHYACSKNLDYPLTIPIIRLFLTKAEQLGVLDKVVNAQDNQGKTPLHDVVDQFVFDDGRLTNDIAKRSHDKKGYLAVRLLLRHGANPNLKRLDKKTPSDLALSKKYFGIARLIQEYTPDFPAKTLPVWQAERRPHSNYNLDLSHSFNQIYDTSSGVHDQEAIKKGLEAWVFNHQEFIRNAKAPQQTLLHAAAWFGCRSEKDIDRLKAIIKYAAYPPDVRDQDLKTPLHYAVQERVYVVDPADDKTVEMIHALLENDNIYYPGVQCDVHAVDKDGNTILHELALRADYKGNKKGKPDNSASIKVVWDYLISRGADIQAKNHAGYTPEQVAFMTATGKAPAKTQTALEMQLEALKTSLEQLKGNLSSLVGKLGMLKSKL